MKLVAIVLSLFAASSSPYVIDGDTLVFGREHIRISNLDAPDIGNHARCALERQRGKASRGFAVALVRKAKSIEVIGRSGQDRYGRTLARVQIDSKDFGNLMINAGHGRPWRGRSSDWCS